MLTNKIKYSLFLILCLHFLAVIFSIGFYNHDEQRQVLQMVGAKLGLYSENYLDFQYNTEIRSWFHPSLYLFLGKCYGLFFNLNPFKLAFFFRLFSSLFGLTSYYLFYRTIENEFDSSQKYFFSIFTLSLWFLPFFHARTSNENIATSFFLLAIWCLFKLNRTYAPLLAGIVFGASFFSRFQMFFLIFPLLLSYVFYKKINFQTLIKISVGFFMALLIVLYIDKSLYGHWTFTPYNYFKVNILEHYLAQFGSEPWYYYFKSGIKEGIPPLSCLYFFSFLYFFYKRPRHPLTISLLFSLLIHMLIGHKELRFLAPFFVFIPYFLTIMTHEQKPKIQKLIIRFSLFLGIPMAVYISLIPASNLVSFYEHLYYKKEKHSIIYTFSPYEDFVKFYRKYDIEYKMISEKDIDEIISNKNEPYFIATTSFQKEQLLKFSQCKIDYALLPTWLTNSGFIKNSLKFKKWNFISCSTQLKL